MEKDKDIVWGVDSVGVNWTESPACFRKVSNESSTDDLLQALEVAKLELHDGEEEARIEDFGGLAFPTDIRLRRIAVKRAITGLLKRANSHVEYLQDDQVESFMRKVAEVRELRDIAPKMSRTA